MVRRLFKPIQVLRRYKLRFILAINPVERLALENRLVTIWAAATTRFGATLTFSFKEIR